MPRLAADTWLFAAHLFTLFSIAASNVLLGLAVLAAPWRLRAGSPQRREVLARWQEARPLLVPLGVYSLLLLVSIAFSYDPRHSGRSVSDLFNFATPVLAPLLLLRRQHVRFVVHGLVALATVVAVYGLGQYVWRALWLGGDDLDHRVPGPFSHYMTFAGILLLCDCLLITYLVFGRGWRRPVAWFALAAINLALFLSYTRNAWVALAVAVTAVILVRSPRWLAAWIPLLALLLLLAPPPLAHRAASIAELENPSNYDRLCMTSAGLHMLVERPLFGLGPGMVSERYPIYRHPSAPRYWVPHLHSSFLNLAAERGLTSLAAFVWLVAAGALAAWRHLRRSGPEETDPGRSLAMGVLIAILAFLVAGLFEDYWVDTEVQRLFLFILALPFCLRDPAAGDEEAPAAPNS